MSTLRERFFAQNLDGKLITVERNEDDKRIVAEGVCLLEDGCYYFLSNDERWDGACPSNKHGYEYSWFICDNDVDEAELELDEFKVGHACSSPSDYVSSTMQFLSEKKFEL